jgi:putative PEP-CTERM system histidine kinase
MAAAVTAIANGARYGAWYVFLWHLIAPWQKGVAASRPPWRGLGLVGVTLLASFVTRPELSIGGITVLAGNRPAYLLHVVLAIFGLILVEQLFRRAHPEARWGIKPLAIAVGGIFGFDLFFYADALLFGGVDRDIWVARGVANLVVIPLVAIATARSTGWTVDLHVSRRVVLQSTTLFISGVFLLVVAGAGYLVRLFGGAWGRALQIELLFGAALGIVLVASSGRFRSRLKVFVSKHFFSYRYDYREEWLRFTGMLSTESATQTLQVRTIAALGDLVESPGGILFVRDESERFVASARWNMPATAAAEPADSPLAAFLARTTWIVDISEFRADPARYVGLVLPDWIESLTSPWLVVPLVSGTDLLGFVVLTVPRTPVTVDWEVRDLVKSASRQAASYLVQVQAAEALLEARKFDAFNRMSAFIVHDLKNLVAQLSLMHKNAARHRDNPEFQADMLATVAHVVDRMNALMMQLRTGTVPVESPRHVNLDAMLQRIVAIKVNSGVPIDFPSNTGALVVAHDDRLERVIGHLVQNAIEACAPNQRVALDVRIDDSAVFISVIDHGVGMTPEFVSERLFKPFQTTKHTGMGIGVYESQQYLSSVGGELKIESAPGLGTRVVIRLKRAEPSRDEASVVSEQSVA